MCGSGCASMHPCKIQYRAGSHRKSTDSPAVPTLLPRRHGNSPRPASPLSLPLTRSPRQPVALRRSAELGSVRENLARETATRQDKSAQLQEAQGLLDALRAERRIYDPRTARDIIQENLVRSFSATA